ncbi:NAD-dependent epimerase/dehydratase family protein [Arthrobacter russicus]|uniref:UDP-glucose 4-epimerase n=1 Tax=Arthrobacter russicus TaxID=172040 RepID=A0ABU1J8D3_9MICC|nr:NAD-dependent epimerase/dehydratase family protein [Arthrobacter russicus]MDR6268424.1 UDP-glucose 4-epimerase [Arthrobacter russicus]
MKILLTGATGFVGREVVSALQAQGHQVVAAVRSTAALPPGVEQRVVGDISGPVAWAEALDGIDTVLHLAARVHQMNDSAVDPLASFRAVNTEPTARLAQAAEAAGVKRFVFLSSIKVNGESTPLNPSQPFSVDSAPAPADPYGSSKFEAEAALAAISASGAMKIATVRSPMVYGPEGRGNVQRLSNLARKGFPVPFGSIRNRRTMIAVQNLADLLVALCPAAPDTPPYSLVLAGDAHSPSTAELYRELADALGVPARILPFPVALLRLAGRLTGRAAEIARLTESLEIRVGSTDPDFDWTPPLSFHEGIARMAR